MLIFGLALVALAAISVVAGWFSRRKLGRILAAPVRRTGEAASAAGAAAVEGTVRASQPLTAPCSGRPCVYYELQLEQKVREKRGNSTTTKWRTLGKPHVGSQFAIDDGSGALMVQAQEALDADLVKTYTGAPPGGPGLGMFANLVQIASHGREEILEYRVTERVIAPDTRLFALGEVRGGWLAPPQSGKLLVSSRGRDALVSSKRRLAIGLFALAGVLAASGTALAIVRPGEARACGPLSDAQHACIVTTKIADGSHGKYHKALVDWKVTHEGKFELELTPVKKSKKDLAPALQVEDANGLPMNVGLNFGLSTESSNDYKTKTRTLQPGTYTILVSSVEDGPDQLLLAIRPLAPSAD